MIIKPEDVQKLVAENKIILGETELEFAYNFNSKDFNIKRGIIIGILKYERSITKYSRFVFQYENNDIMYSEQAKFPKPDLKDNDPVIVSDSDEKCIKGIRIYREHFCKFDKETIMVYGGGMSKWTHEDENYTYAYWRLPTPDELEKGGYPRDYYTSRGIK